MLHILTRVGTLLVAALIGVAFGAAGTVAHTGRIGPLPTGIVIGIVGVAAIVLAVRLLTGDRGATVATALGVVAAVILLAGRGPGGSVLVPQDGAGIAWIVAVTVVLLLIVAWPSLPQRVGQPVAPASPASAAPHTTDA